MKEIDRSCETITDEDLKRLAAIAAKDRASFFSQYPRYKDAKLLCVALCQGAALHYVNGENGVKDFDVWTFYERTQQTPDFPTRRLTQYDFGESKFGKHPDDENYLGRRVDVIGRSIDVKAGSPVGALQEYFTARKNKSARCLAEKAVVLLEPTPLRGTVVWPLRQGERSEAGHVEEVRL